MSYLGTRRSESIQSSNSPSNTAETSTYGSQTVKPLPIKSIAARRMGEYAGNFLLGGCCKRNVKALPEFKNDQNCFEILIVSVDIFLGIFQKTRMRNSVENIALITFAMIFITDVH